MKKNKKFFAHQTAVIDRGAKIGKGTKIWHFSHIMNGAQVGTNCNLGQNVFVGKGARIGNNVKIQNNVSLYEGVILEDYVFCGPSVTFTNVLKPRSKFPVKGNYQKTIIKRGATLGANASIVCTIEIGEHAFIGAGSVVTKDIPAYALFFGNPARFNGWICECGNKLTTRNKRVSCSFCKKTYLEDNNSLKPEK